MCSAMGSQRVSGTEHVPPNEAYSSPATLSTEADPTERRRQPCHTKESSLKLFPFIFQKQVKSIRTTGSVLNAAK